jgi:hypothetical protein
VLVAGRKITLTPREQAMTRNQYRTLLLADKIMPAAEAEERLAAHRQYKEHVRVGKLAKMHRKPLWRALINPLKRDINSVETSLAYVQRRADDASALKAEALAAYRDNVMVPVKLAIERAMTDGLADFTGETPGTPIRYVKWHNRHYANPHLKPPAGVARHIWNNGEHWSDWVSEARKEKTLVMFAHVNTNRALHGREFVPFRRKPEGQTTITRPMAAAATPGGASPDQPQGEP